MEIEGGNSKTMKPNISPRNSFEFSLDQGKIKQFRLLIEADTQFSTGGKRLKIHGPHLETLPNEIFSLNELEVLDLSPERESCLYFRVIELPPAIGRLTNLKVLMLDTNYMYQIPDEICLLKKLEKISLSNNRFTSLPQNFSSLKCLVSLHLANNSFVVFPDVILKLENLKFLDMCDNHLTQLPENIGDMKYLETLLLFKNKLTDLPESICELKELRILWLGNNNISRLPFNFGQLCKLDWGVSYTTSSAIDGNPLTRPPLEICRQGTTAIGRFFKMAKRVSMRIDASKPKPGQENSTDNQLNDDK